MDPNVQLRARTTKAATAAGSNGGNSTNPEGASEQKRRATLAQRLKSEWDSIFWIITSFAILYYTNFASVLLFEPKINRLWLLSAVILLGVTTVCGVYVILYRPRLNSNNWQRTAPVLIPCGTVTCIVGGICFTVSVWPVWRYFTLAIVPTLFMGFISAISLFDL